MKPVSLVLAVSTLLLSACQQQEPSSTADTSKTVSEPAAQSQSADAELGAWGIDLAQMDSDIVPGNDFADYVNGQWYDSFEIPADRASYGIFIALRERSTEQVRDIIDDLTDNQPQAGSIEQKVADYYRTWLDVEALNAKAAKPLAPQLSEIAAIDDQQSLMRAFGNLHLSAPFGIGILPDPADTTRYTLFAGQSGLGMPDREYYLSADERFVEFRKAYRDYIERVQQLAGIENAAAKADAILALETSLAEVHWPREMTRDIQKIYNPMAPAKLAEIAPKIDWSGILEQLGLASAASIMVAQPDVMTASGDIIENTALQTWKDYLAFHFISDNASLLSAEFDQAQFEFFSKTLNGIEEQRERWKRGSDLVNRNLGEAVGQIYVQRHFPPAAKQQMDELVVNLRAALKERILQNAWMDEATREAALTKLATFEPRIGYPSKWIDYASLNIENGDMLGNQLAVTEFQWQRDVDRLDGPVERDEWGYPPQTVNASYNPLLNQLTFPAGILQPPFFDPGADAAVNYGAIGAVIGHEMGHGFDDQGRRFDETGKIRDWWTAAADEAFSQRTDQLGAQYDSYEPLPGMHINGQLTMGENIGDLGGVEMAWSAYQKFVAEHGEPAVLDGFTGAQRFFMAWAQVWRAKSREDALRQQLLTDPHSPAKYRINGIVRNVDAWYEAFDVQPDDALYLPPDQRVNIW
jgi:putative endopeptidase